MLCSMQVVMDFRHPDGRKIPVFLQSRSLLLMSGEARYLWTHGIAARQFDEVHSEMPGIDSACCQISQPSQSCQSRSTTSTILPRGIRTSLTFRKVRRRPCICVCGKYAASKDNITDGYLLFSASDYPSLQKARQK